MSPVRCVVACVLAAGLASLAPGRVPAVQADDAWLRIETNEMAYAFSESLTFRLSATGHGPIQRVLLRYTTGDGRPVNRRVPAFDAGQRVLAQHREQLWRGSIAPASMVSWWWEVTDGAGRTTITQPRRSRYLDGRHAWRSTTFGHIRVWWYGSREAEADRVGKAASADLERLEDLIGATPGSPVEIVTYASQADLRPALLDRGETYEARLATLGARVGPDTLVLDTGSRTEDLEDIIAHELSHLVLHRHLDRDYIDVPAWLDEGLAMYVEGPLETGEARDLELAIDRDEIMSVRSLTSFPGEADLVPLAYAQSRDIVQFLLDSAGEDAFRRLVDSIGSGETTVDEALEQVYGSDQFALYQDYRAARGLGAAATPSAAEPRPRRGAAGPRPCPSALVLPGLAAVVVLAGRARQRAAGPADGPDTERPQVRALDPGPTDPTR